MEVHQKLQANWHGSGSRSSDSQPRLIGLPFNGAMEDGKQNLSDVVAVEGVTAIQGEVHENTKGPPQTGGFVFFLATLAFWFGIWW